ncbi:MAG: helix-turn-helix domain-containing protein, partial [Pseudonocardiaceae bacterium]
GRRLAELRKAAGCSQHEFAPVTLYARSTLANVEIGRQHVPQSFWQRCDEALGTDGALSRSYEDLQALIRRHHEEAAQQAAGAAGEPPGSDSPQDRWKHSEWAVTWDPMRRRTLFAWGLTTTAATGLGAGSGAVGSADIARLQRAETRLHRLAAQHGGEMLWQAAADAVGEGRLMLERGSYGSSVGQELLVATGRLQICAGWLAFDSGRHDIAQVCDEGALALARQAGDPELEVQALAHLARGSNVLDRPREAQRFASAAGDVATSAGVSTRLAVIPQFRRAVASSLMADARGADQAIKQARTTLDRERDEPVEEWCAFVTPFEIDGIEATCALELGHAARAQRLLEKVVIGYGPRFRRNRALYAARLARARLDNSEVDGAAEAANVVLDDLSGEVASWRVSSELDTVACRLAEHPQVEGVSQFQDRHRAMSA